MVKINNGKNSYLYCNLSDKREDYVSQFGSAKECLDHLIPLVKDDCKKFNYNEYEIDIIVAHYEIEILNSNVKWAIPDDIPVIVGVSGSFVDTDGGLVFSGTVTYVDVDGSRKTSTGEHSKSDYNWGNYWGD